VPRRRRHAICCPDGDRYGEVGIDAGRPGGVFEKNSGKRGNPLTREHAGTGLGLFDRGARWPSSLGGEVTLQSELAGSIP